MVSSTSISEIDVFMRQILYIYFKIFCLKFSVYNLLCNLAENEYLIKKLE